MKHTNFYTLRGIFSTAKRIGFLAVFSLAVSFVHGQNLPELVWSKNYPAIYSDFARHIVPTRDGGFVIVGDSQSYGPGIISTMLVKCDSIGEMEWYQVYGGDSYDLPYAVIQTPDDGFLIATYTTSFEPEGTNIRLIKTNATGEEQWASLLPNSNGCIIANTGCLVQTADQGYMVAGYGWRPPNANQIVLFKINQDGEYMWAKEIGGDDDDYGANIQPTADGNYMLAGHTYSYGSGKCDGYLVKVDENGDELWSAAYGEDNFDSFYFVRPTSDGGYIAVGSTQSYGKSEQGFVVKTDAEGTVEWTAAVGGAGNEGFEGVVETANKEFLLSGMTNSFGNGEHDLYLVRLSQTGQVLDEETYGSTNDDFGANIEYWPGKGYLVAGSYYSTTTYFDFWAMLFEGDNQTSVSTQLASAQSLILFEEIAPNPFTDHTSFQFELQENSHVIITLYTMNGALVDEITSNYYTKGKHQFDYHGQNITPGMYLCKIQTDKASVVRKISKIK